MEQEVQSSGIRNFGILAIPILRFIPILFNRVDNKK